LIRGLPEVAPFVLEIPQKTALRADEDSAGAKLRKPMKTFEVLEHTADIGIIAYGADLNQAFSHAAEGLFSLIIDLDTVREKSVRPVKVTASDVELLLASWLNELIYIFDAEYLVFRRFEITNITAEQLTANCYGEKVNRHRHKLKTGVKAATYHKLQVVEADGYRVQVIFDV
jgi:SHS2 domain-containing protein